MADRSADRSEERLVFLGWGRVTQALAQVLCRDRGAAEAIVVDEQIDHGGPSCLPQNLRLGRVVAAGDTCHVAWQPEAVDGNFDTFDFQPYLPARVFISPGIDCRRPFFKALEAFERRELDEFSARFKGKIIAITGTDGKSTATWQLGELLRRALPGQSVFVGGNIGHAMMHALLENPRPHIAVIEMSSYQCERLRSARIDTAILLNLASDHLDRYDQLEDYFRAKWNLLRFAQNIFYPHDCRPLVQGLPPSKGYYLNDAEMEIILREVITFLARSWSFDVSEDLFKNLPRLPHRLEVFKGWRNMTYVNDSKATTVHATLYGLKWAQARFPFVHLLVGGRDKGDDFSPLVAALRADDELILFGEAAERIEAQCRSFPKRRKFSHLREALRGWRAALDVDGQDRCLLLSPACSSFDEFHNFEERGDFFKSELSSNFEGASIQ